MHSQLVCGTATRTEYTIALHQAEWHGLFIARIYENVEGKNESLCQPDAQKSKECMKKNIGKIWNNYL